MAGRTSSFAYKERDQGLRTIGQELNVTTILEGSVRKDGERIRITAQLINAADGYHLWSQVFDRDLTDIFSIQEEIASEVAGALGVRLGVGDVNAFIGAGTQNVEAYEAYLKGWSMEGGTAEALPYLEKATRLDPNYAVAWAELGLQTASLSGVRIPKTRRPSWNVPIHMLCGQLNSTHNQHNRHPCGPQSCTRGSTGLNEGDPGELRKLLAALPPAAMTTRTLYAPVLRDFASRDAVLGTLRAIAADDSVRWPDKYHDIALLAAYFGDAGFALQTFERDARHMSIRLQALWYPVMSEVRQLPGFKDLVRDINLVAYWRAFEWPEACQPLGGDEFSCN